VLLLSALTAAWASDCPAPSHAAELDAKVSAAERAYADLDVTAFRSSLDEATLIVGCLDDVVPSTTAAHYLRMMGVRYFVDREEARADQAFAEARRLDPAYTFPDALIPPGHALRTHYTALDAASVASSRIPAPKSGKVLVDGTAAENRPGLPVIVQVTDAAGVVTQSRYVVPGDPLPPYEAVALPPAPTEITRRPPNPGVPFVIGAGAAAVASGVLYGVALDARHQFEAPVEGRTYDDLVGLQSRANGLVYASAGAGALAIAGGVTAVFVGRW
jgi:hypothetical protein